MKKWWSLVLLLFALSVNGSAQSQNSIKLVNAVQELTQLMINPDEAKLERITHKKLSYGHSSGRIEDQATFIGSLLTGESDFETINLNDQSYEVVDNIGIARHILVAKTNDNGNPGNVKIGVMMIWRDSGDSWELLARQAYKLPTP
ncbi:nuclear transport factor 2 family protein [Echinicola strongylocentroti]|uniref:Nuclear transport factor 2 family protein n=1 Tax=Echinicola strongylocentroti TaxID=1795355 RepID=A0A2Z4IMR1_9BACT|nr:nuclear transport factor 2 family protein [Echinicola strongylocentroti]AWW31673.1 nuclear transport factor 2 family protein [Echinicola strongylocentroti]